MKKHRKKTKCEFSKFVLSLIMFTYFAGVIIGTAAVIIDVTQVGAVLAFIGAPTATAIAFYAWKAKAENVIKISRKYPNFIDEIKNN